MLRPQATVRDVLSALHDMVTEIPGFCRELKAQRCTDGEKARIAVMLSYVFFSDFVWLGLKGREATVWLTSSVRTPHGVYHPSLGKPKPVK